MNKTNEMTEWLNEYEYFEQDINKTQWDSDYDTDNQYYEDDNWSGYRYQ